MQASNKNLGDTERCLPIFFNEYKYLRPYAYLDNGVIYDANYKIFLNLTNFSKVDGKVCSSTPAELDDNKTTVTGKGETPLDALRIAFN